MDLTTHKGILEYLSRPEADDYSEILDELWFYNKNTCREKIGDLELPVELIHEETTDVSEGTVTKIKVFNINGLLFLRETESNSWSDYYEVGELVQAKQVMRVSYEVVK